MRISKSSATQPAPARKSRIFLVDDHPIVLTGFQLLLNSQPDFEVCGTARSAEEALERVPGINPDLIKIGRAHV